MKYGLACGTAVLAALLAGTAGARAAPPGAWALSAVSAATRDAIADYQLKDVVKISGALPEIIVARGGGFVVPTARPLLDLRVINIMLVNRARVTPQPYAASTGAAIDAWTAAVQYGRPAPYGSSVDQWVAMAYSLGPL